MSSRLFLSGSIVMGVFALAHLGGFLQAVYVAQQDPGMAELTRAMREQKSSLMGFHPSILDFRYYFSLNFSILLLLASALGIATIAMGHEQAATIRMLAPIYAVGMLLLLGTSVYFSVVQGIITCSIIAMLFGLAWWLS